VSGDSAADDERGKIVITGKIFAGAALALGLTAALTSLAPADHRPTGLGTMMVADGSSPPPPPPPPPSVAAVRG
jgi:hypothetical protein